MRIANYLRPDCVALRQRADSLTGAVQQMVTLLDGTDNLTDTAVFAADVRARLALGGVCVGNGLAIPHAKSTAVRQLQLAALTLDPPLPCDTPDGKPLDLLVMIAAPAEANDLHVQVLAELATLFLDTDFCARLRESETPEAFCRAISAREEQDAQEPPSAPSDAAPGAAKPSYQLLAVTACPTGIAHTYLAAEALQMRLGSIALVAGETIAGVFRVHLRHYPVADDLGDDRGGGDGEALVLPADDLLLGKGDLRKMEAVDEQEDDAADAHGGQQVEPEALPAAQHEGRAAQRGAAVLDGHGHGQCR